MEVAQTDGTIGQTCFFTRSVQGYNLVLVVIVQKTTGIIGPHLPV